MWSSLLGFTEVCSIMTFPGLLGKGSGGVLAAAARWPGSKAKFKNPPTAITSRTPSIGGSAAFSASAILGGGWRRTRASWKGRGLP